MTDPERQVRERESERERERERERGREGEGKSKVGSRGLTLNASTISRLSVVSPTPRVSTTSSRVRTMCLTRDW